jgi:hypothetical protein
MVRWSNSRTKLLEQKCSRQNSGFGNANAIFIFSRMFVPPVAEEAFNITKNFFSNAFATDESRAG